MIDHSKSHIGKRVEIIETFTISSDYRKYIGKKGYIMDLADNSISYAIKLDGYLNTIPFNKSLVTIIYDEIIIDTIFKNLDKLEKKLK